MRRRQLLTRVATLLALLAPVVAARAEVPCRVRSESRDGERWPAPLDRVVTLHARDVALRDALDRLSAAARLRLSYAAELLTLDRRVCVSYDSVAAGVVLSDLLDGAAVTPVVAGADQVVLAPSPAQRRAAAPRAEQQVNVLDRVLVTDNPLDAADGSLASAVTIVTRSQLARQASGTLSQTLNSAVPGVWLWDQAPASFFAQYGSLRGASSFQVSYPKIYIDGIEVANPLLLTELSPDAVERVEVIRGPQGAALYGADAIGGVINVVMRHDGGDGGEVAQLRSSAGLSHSAFASRPVLVQEHTLGLRGGGELRSSALSLSLGTIGSYVPGGQSWTARGDGGFRIIGARSMVTGTVRVYAKDAGIASNPLISGASPQLTPPPTDREPWRNDGPRDFNGPMTTNSALSNQSLREYTLGSTATLFANETWTHALTVGVDGYRLTGGGSPADTPILSSIDSAVRAARGGADRATIRASSEARFGAAAGAAATITLAAEQSSLLQRTDGEASLPLGNRLRAFSGWQSNTGFIGQAGASWRDALFATTGLRVERDVGLAATNGLATLPTLGAAAIHEFGPVSTKLRGAYGRSIRPAGSVLRTSWAAREAVVQGTLAPEEQSGIEAGIDATIGRFIGVHLTRFDQSAYNLIQPVAITSTLMPSPTDGRLMYALQNVGEISNRGWELESSVNAARLSLTGTLSLVDSRVRRLAYGYTGDLRPGDRMLGVPVQSGSLTSSWTAARWSSSLTLTRAANWINYDGLALASISTSTQPIVGEQLRRFWRSYPGVTRLDATFSRQFFSGFSFTITGRNLLDVQRGEPDNLTVLPGRTISAGMSLKF